MAVRKENLKKGSGFFKQQHEQNVEGMKKKRKKAVKKEKKHMLKGGRANVLSQ